MKIFWSCHLILKKDHWSRALEMTAVSESFIRQRSGPHRKSIITRHKSLSIRQTPLLITGNNG